MILITCYINYYTGFHFWLRGQTFLYSLVWYLLLFFIFFCIGLLIENHRVVIQKKAILVFVATAALFFALKVALPFAALLQFLPEAYQHAFKQPAAWLGGVIVVSILLTSYHRFTEGRWQLYGTKKSGSLGPYFLLVALMIPLLVWAADQHDFSLVYPRAKVIATALGSAAKPWHYGIFEASYATDFISIELFFRGFLIVVLSKWLGRNAVLPIAMFYFSIHLGKPMFEAISSFFGGMILGTISYQTQSIRGGWLVHVSIALLMELFGFLFQQA